MGTYRRVFIPSKFSSVENANKKHKSSVSACKKNGVVNVCIFDGTKSLLGKMKAFVEEKKVDYHTFGDNYNGYGYQDHYHDYYLNAKDGKAFVPSRRLPDSLARYLCYQIKRRWRCIVWLPCSGITRIRQK